MLQIALVLQVETAAIEIPKDAVNYGSSCASIDKEFLQIVFFNTTGKPWSFDINIVKSNKAESQLGYSADGDVTYSWKNVELTYYIDSHFKDAKDTSGTIKTENLALLIKKGW